MRFLFATGGTAGHINPAIAVASYIREKYADSEILFIGTADHMESRLVPNAGFDFKTIEINGFKRSMSPKAIADNVKTVFKLIKSEGESKKIIKEFNPDVVIGFGGYVSGPVLDEAVKLHEPCGSEALAHLAHLWVGERNPYFAHFAGSEEAVDELDVGAEECHIR